MIQVFEYELFSKNGIYIRKATGVRVFQREIKFLEKMSRRKAIKQALEILKKSEVE